VPRRRTGFLAHDYRSGISGFERDGDGVLRCLIRVCHNIEPRRLHAHLLGGQGTKPRQDFGLGDAGEDFTYQRASPNVNGPARPPSTCYRRGGPAETLRQAVKTRHSVMPASACEPGASSVDTRHINGNEKCIDTQRASSQLPRVRLPSDDQGPWPVAGCLASSALPSATVALWSNSDWRHP
jgi:hypothetical protein